MADSWGDLDSAGVMTRVGFVVGTDTLSLRGDRDTGVDGAGARAPGGLAEHLRPNLGPDTVRHSHAPAVGCGPAGPTCPCRVPYDWKGFSR